MRLPLVLFCRFLSLLHSVLRSHLNFEYFLRPFYFFFFYFFVFLFVFIMFRFCAIFFSLAHDSFASAFQGNFGGAVCALKKRWKTVNMCGALHVTIIFEYMEAKIRQPVSEKISAKGKKKNENRHRHRYTVGIELVVRGACMRMSAHIRAYLFNQFTSPANDDDDGDDDDCLARTFLCYRNVLSHFIFFLHFAFLFFFSFSFLPSGSLLLVGGAPDDWTLVKMILFKFSIFRLSVHFIFLQ